MTAEPFCQHLSRLLASANPPLHLELAARSIAAFFDVEPHEVAFFKIDSNCRLATLRWPSSSSAGSTTIPLKTFGSSLLSTTVQKRHALVDNHFAQTRHLHMVEHSLTERKDRIPVQKIISIPVPHEGELRWVLQISRKGKTAESAGNDFVDADLKNLELVAKCLAPFPLQE